MFYYLYLHALLSPSPYFNSFPTLYHYDIYLYVLLNYCFLPCHIFTTFLTLYHYDLYLHALLSPSPYFNSFPTLYHYEIYLHVLLSYCVLYTLPISLIDLIILISICTSSWTTILCLVILLNPFPTQYHYDLYLHVLLSYCILYTLYLLMPGFEGTMLSECCFGKHSSRAIARELCTSQSNTLRA